MNEERQQVIVDTLDKSTGFLMKQPRRDNGLRKAVGLRKVCCDFYKFYELFSHCKQTAQQRKI